MNPQQQVKLKRQTIQIYSSPERYQSYKRAMTATSGLYEDDFSFYNDSVSERHTRNMAEIKKILQALQEKKITPDMLEYNTNNTFYPSYILSHHYNHFTQVVAGLNQNHPELKDLLQKCHSFTTIGAIFDNTINTNFKKQTPVITVENGLVTIPQDFYFYSFKTNPYICMCCFQAKQSNKNVTVFVQLRTQNGNLSPNVIMKDLGASIAPDYLTVGYRINGVKPLFIIQQNNNKHIKEALSNDAVMEIGYSIQDLINSLYITVKYTSMRKQFSTYENSKNERPILEYQAVSARIADGFATLYGLSFLRQRLLNMLQFGQFMKFYMPFIHQVVLERLIDLRQCCGGFGYLQMSGHPGYLQRVSIRSAQFPAISIPKNNQIMKRLHYYSNDLTREPEYIKQITKQGNQRENIFYLFVITCMRMRQNKQKINPRSYLKEFFKQSCTQMMYSNNYFDPMDAENPLENFLLLMIIKHVINNSKYLYDSEKLKIESYETLHQNLINQRTSLLLKISKDLPKLCETLQVGKLRNVIIGEKEESKFYDRVMIVSQNNKRNSPEYTDYILKNLKNVVKEQRATL